MCSFLTLNTKRSKINLKSNLHYTRGITPKRVTSGGAHLGDLAPGRRSREELLATRVRNQDLPQRQCLVIQKNVQVKRNNSEKIIPIFLILALNIGITNEYQHVIDKSFRTGQFVCRLFQKTDEDKLLKCLVDVKLASKLFSEP